MPTQSWRTKSNQTPSASSKFDPNKYGKPSARPSSGSVAGSAYTFSSGYAERDTMPSRGGWQKIRAYVCIAIRKRVLPTNKCNIRTPPKTHPASLLYSQTETAKRRMMINGPRKRTSRRLTTTMTATLIRRFEQARSVWWFETHKSKGHSPLACRPIRCGGPGSDSPCCLLFPRGWSYVLTFFFTASNLWRRSQWPQLLVGWSGG